MEYFGFFTCSLECSPQRVRIDQDGERDQMQQWAHSASGRLEVLYLLRRQPCASAGPTDASAVRPTSSSCTSCGANAVKLSESAARTTLLSAASATILSAAAICSRVCAGSASELLFVRRECRESAGKDRYLQGMSRSKTASSGLPG